MRYAIGVFIVVPLLLMFPWIWGVNYDLSLITIFVDTPTLLAFILAIAAVLFITGEAKIFAKTVNALFSKKYVISYEDKERGIKLLLLLKKVIIYAAVFHTASGVILILSSLNEPSQLGPMLAITIISIMYAVAINLIFIVPAIHILKNRKTLEEKPAISEKQVISKLLELCYKQGISPEEILEADEINLRGKARDN